MKLQILKNHSFELKILKDQRLNCKYIKMKGLNMHLQMHKDHMTEYVVANT